MSHDNDFESVKTRILEHDTYKKYRNLVDLLKDIQSSSFDMSKEMEGDEEAIYFKWKYDFCTDLLIFMGEEF